MKIYFSASLHGGVGKEIYQKMVDTIIGMGHKVMADHVLKNTPESLDKQTAHERMQYHRNMSKAITLCDLVVCEVSYPSTISIGHEVTLALDKGKPVVALYQPRKEPGVLQGIHSDRFMLLEYDMKGIGDVLDYALEEAAEKIDIRYNFFISPKMVRFLDYISKTTKVPRAVFLRRLIEKDLEMSGYKG